MGWSLPVRAWPSRGDSSPISVPPHARSALLRSPPPPTTQLAVKHHHHAPLPPLSRPEGSPSTRLRVATGCSPSRRSVTPGATVLHRRLPRGAHRRPPSPSTSSPTKSTASSLFMPCCSPTQSSALAASHLHRQRPPLHHCLPHRRVGCLGEPLYVKLVPIKSLGARLAPWHHLAWPLAAGWSDLVGGAAPMKGRNRSPVSAHGLKGYNYSNQFNSNSNLV
jgi:hypothetical protein